MKPRQFIVLIVWLIAVGLLTYVALTAWWQPPPPPPTIDASKLISAVQTFSRDRREQAQAMPASLTLRELIAGGYLATNDVQAFEGTEVTFLLSADLNRPREVVIRVRLRDGSQMVVLANGTVEHLPK